MSVCYRTGKDNTLKLTDFFCKPAVNFDASVEYTSKSEADDLDLSPRTHLHLHLTGLFNLELYD